ncbi:cytochrome P450 [Streptomyces sp. NPDC048389]|uniref:cytochrome P450 n=1 Tax=Streptomyces sp. NPDC048389 TaxID=3154622 RepID=UPI00345206AA
MTGRPSVPSSDRRLGGGSGDAVCPVTSRGEPDGTRAEGAEAADAAQPGGGRPAHKGGRERVRDGGAGHARARRRDRRVYLRAHPFLFALLAAGRGRPVRRIGRTVLVHGADAYREVLTRLPLDRTAPGTTGGAARSAIGAGGDGSAASPGVLFDQDGGAHRALRRGLVRDLGTAGVEELRSLWRPLMERRLEPLAAGGTVDVVALTRELAGTVVCALLGSAASPSAVAAAAAEVAAVSVRSELPGPPRPGARAAVARATDRLRQLLGGGGDTGGAPGGGPGWSRGPEGPEGTGSDGGDGSGGSGGSDEALSAMVAVAAVNTSVAALPRAAAWCADAGLWEQAADDTLRRSLTGELLRVTAASPLLPRVAAADGAVGGCPVRSGDRLLLVARHAVGAHTGDPDALHPAPPAVARLVFGAGPHTCPGAGLAGALLEDLLAALAPYRPAVVRARVDRGAALPSWRTLTLRATASAVPR